jgi:Protein of unknown function (DUF3105)
MRRTLLVAVAAACLVSLVTACSSSPSPSSAASSATGAASVGVPAPEGIDGVLAFAAVDPKTDQAHVGGKPSYPTTPPTRGPHNAIWQNCGFYTKPVADENAVHSLEHGAVWITYLDTADAATRSTLATLAKSNNYVLITPYAANPAPIVLTAWGRQLRVDTITDSRVARFIATYARTGPTTPEVGAACSGALGIPPDRPSTIVS